MDRSNEHVPFMKNEQNDSFGLSLQTSTKRQWKSSRGTLLAVANVLILFLDVIVLIRYSRAFAKGLSCSDIPPSPANGLVAYNLRTYDESTVNAFAGKPRAELEDAWDDLMRAEVIRATEEDLIIAHGGVKDTMPLEHGGYLASLSAYHPLHCTEWIKRNYARVESMEELHEKEDHLDHCLQVIRESAMCHADLTIDGFHWVEGSEVPIPRFGQKHLCTDFGVVHEWALQRSLKPGERGVRPDGTFGAAHDKYRFEEVNGTFEG